jgi:DNA polymerase-4
MHALFSSVWGDRMYHWLRGHQTGDDEAGSSFGSGGSAQKSLGHSHVLAPEHRTPDGSWAVAHKLLHKAAMRLRMEHFYCGSLSVAIRFALTRDQAASAARAKKHFSGINHEGWGMEARFAPCQDTLTLLEALRGVWEQRPTGPLCQRPFFVGITLSRLLPEADYQPGLFTDPTHRGDLSHAMDKLNLKYGHTTLHFAGMMPARASAPTRIAFTQIPVKYGVDYM